MILARAGRQMVTICYYGRLEVFLADSSPGPGDKPSPAATSRLSSNPLADLLLSYPYPDVVMVKTGNKWISIRDKIIVKLRRGSGKDRQGMAVKAKGLKA